MLRFILKHSERDEHINFESEDYFTIDLDIPQLESILKDGGKGPAGYL